MCPRAATVEPETGTELLQIPLAQILPSKLNPRRPFAKGSLDELAASLRSVGLIEPILVRPAEDRVRYELVAGHRRLEAAKLAGLGTLPTMVRELDDKEALEIIVVENQQRADLHPLEEADGYRQLIERHGYDVEQLAAKVAKSKAYIYARLKLGSLAKPARAAFLDGKLDASKALLVARIPAGLQDKALKAITTGRWGDDGDGMSYREAERYVHDEFMLRLAGAPFDPKDPQLVPKAGPCGSCPKLSGNQPELFGDVKGADVCTDPICYRAKADAAWGLAKASGARVLSEKQCKQLFPYDHDHEPRSGEFVSPSGSYTDQRTWRSTKWSALCKGARLETYLARSPHTGKTFKLWKKSEALAAAKKAGRLKAPRSKSSAKAGPWQPPSWKVYPVQRRLAIEAIVEKYEGGSAMTAPEALGLIGRTLVSYDCVEVAERRGLIKAGAFQHKKAEEAIRAEISKLSGSKLLALVLELLVEAISCHEKAVGVMFSGAKWGALGNQAIAQLAEERKAKLAAKKSAPAKGAKLEKGVCRECGCTEDSACEGGCAWTDRTQTLCTSCAEDES